MKYDKNTDIQDHIVVLEETFVAKYHLNDSVDDK